LVVLGVAKLDYLISDNQKLSRINHSLNEINERNAAYMVQIEGLNKELNEELSEEIKRKKKWRKATLYSVGFNVIFLTSLYVLSR
jgi:predicted  nucleic acid-binding Zn-ribbon protein